MNQLLENYSKAENAINDHLGYDGYLPLNIHPDYWWYLAYSDTIYYAKTREHLIYALVDEGVVDIEETGQEGEFWITEMTGEIHRGKELTGCSDYNNGEQYFLVFENDKELKL